MVGRDHADGHDMLGVDDDGRGGHRDYRIEVARGQHIGEVAEVVGEKRLDQREVRSEWKLEQVLATADVDLALPLLDDGAHAGRRKDPAEP